MLCLTLLHWCSLFWCFTLYLQWRIMTASVCAPFHHWPWKRLSLVHIYVPDDFNILFAFKELSFLIHGMDVRCCIRKVLTVFRWMTDTTTHRRRSYAFTVDSRNFDVSCQTRSCCSWPKSSLEHVECGLTSTCTQVRIMMCLLCTILSLAMSCKQLQVYYTARFLLLCVWHAAYVSWWDLNWVCLHSSKYTDCEWKQPNYQGLFWFNRQSVGWKIMQKLIMTWNWQWPESNLWTSCFLDTSTGHVLQHVFHADWWYQQKDKHPNTKKAGVFSDVNGLQASLEFFLACFLFTSKAWKPKSTSHSRVWLIFGPFTIHKIPSRKLIE